jgi:hypothetical protein
MEPGCKLEDFGRLAQPAATNRLRCRVNVVSERYLVETHFSVWCNVKVWSMHGIIVMLLNVILFIVSGLCLFLGFFSLFLFCGGGFIVF